MKYKKNISYYYTARETKVKNFCIFSISPFCCTHINSSSLNAIFPKVVNGHDSSQLPLLIYINCILPWLLVINREERFSDYLWHYFGFRIVLLLDCLTIMAKGPTMPWYLIHNLLLEGEDKYMCVVYIQCVHRVFPESGKN